jgi:hypothetical protein
VPASGWATAQTAVPQPVHENEPIVNDCGCSWLTVRYRFGPGSCGEASFHVEVQKSLSDLVRRHGAAHRRIHSGGHIHQLGGRGDQRFKISRRVGRCDRVFDLVDTLVIPSAETRSALFVEGLNYEQFRIRQRGFAC